MIAPRLLHRLLFGLTLISGAASAVGLGEITLHSRIGEPLRAEVPVSAGGESLDAACFSLAPLPGADFPVITAGRTRLVRIGQDYRLIISGSQAIDEPVVAINLRAACGLDLQREYVLLPAPPLAAVAAAGDMEPPAARALPRYRPPTNETSGESWSSDSATPNPPANKRHAPRKSQNAGTSARPPQTLAGMAGGKDRVVLGAALEQLPAPAGADPLAPINELDERLLKMETTLHLLNQEVGKLDTAINLATEARAAREKLQDMQARQSPPGLLPSVQAASPQAPVRSTSKHDGWLELLLGLLLGGSVSAGVAHWVSRRQDHARTVNALAPKPEAGR